MEHFAHLIEGRVLTLVTDHKPLTYMFTMKKRCKLERRSRYIEYVSQITTDIMHISGLSNVIADTLSHTEVDSVTATVDNKRIAEQQLNDPEIQVIRRNGFREHDIRDIHLEDNASILCSYYKQKTAPLFQKSLDSIFFHRYTHKLMLVFIQHWQFCDQDFSGQI